MHGGDETVLASTVWKCKFDFLLCILSFFYLLYQPKCGHVKMLKQFSLFFICLVNFLFDELLKANGEEKIGVGEFLNYVMLSDDLIHFWSFRWLLSELSKFLWNLNLNEMKKFRLKFYLNYEIFWIFPTVFVIVKYLKFWFALNHCVIVQILSKIKVLSLPFFDEAESFLMSRIKSFSWFIRSQCTVQTQDAALFSKKIFRPINIILHFMIKSKSLPTCLSSLTWHHWQNPPRRLEKKVHNITIKYFSRLFYPPSSHT